MTRLLISVRDAVEARVALNAGADIIDLKEPDAGALGAVPVDVAREVVHLVGTQRPVSATVGDLPLDPDVIVPAVSRMAAAGMSYVKVGLWPGTGMMAETLAALGPLACRIPLIAVLFADHVYPASTIDLAARAGFAGVMLDTADKSGGRLTEHAGRDVLEQFIRRARRHGLITGLAGSLRIGDVRALAELGPDYLGFRGAACESDVRGAAIQRERVAMLRRELEKPARSNGSARAGIAA